jgi:tRNA-splicing ligase RtcB
MGKNTMRGKHLRELDFPSDIAKSLAVTILSRHFKKESIEHKINLLKQLLQQPDLFLDHTYLKPLAESIVGKPKIKTDYEVHMLQKAGNFQIFGDRLIELGAKEQMHEAMRLPIAVKGALMPDAHRGYGLPIGAVLACKDAVIPYGVGLDIGCRMALSIYDCAADNLEKKERKYYSALRNYTHFGTEGTLDFEVDHEVLQREEFQETALLKRLHGKAWFQLGSSGTGNHFVEFGEVELYENNVFKLPEGKYLGLLSHSGSRGMGAAIASYYTKIARDTCKLPPSFQSLAWLNLNEDAGREYWMSMNLAGDYAKACHEVIHQNLERVLGLNAIAKVDNHHNFAWKEQIGDEELIVHRKGATPASANQLGIIPGTMCSPGFIVSGKGNPDSLFSASHGAGRKLSRSAARENIQYSLKESIAASAIKLLGGSKEESPMAYKNIHEVMKYQEPLVQVEGSFLPKIVRMNKS